MKRLILIVILIILIMVTGCGKSYVMHEGFTVEESDTEDARIVFGEGDAKTVVIFDDDGMHIDGDKSNVDINKEGLKVEDEFGEITKLGPKDGVLVYDSKGGTDVIIGSVVELPEGWPIDIVLPADMEIKTTYSKDGYMFVTGFVDQQPEDARDYFRDILNSFSHYKETNTDNTVTISGDNDEYSVKIRILGYENSSVSVIVRWE